MTRSLFALLLAAGLAQSAPVFAQTSEADKSAAETLFDEGRRLMSQGKYADACPKLFDSNKLDPGLGTLLNLGQCYKSLGHTASAWSTFREAAAVARSSGQSDRESLARKEASALEPGLMRLLIEVPPEVAASSPQIRRDGAAVPQSLWGLPTPVDPGVHAIEVSATGKRAQHIEVSTSSPGSTTKVAIPLLADEPNAAAAPTTVAASSATAAPSPGAVSSPSAASSPLTSPAPAAPASDRSGLRLTGFVVGGLGLVAAGAGVAFLVLGDKENDKALALCKGGPDGNQCDNAVESRNHETHQRAARDNFTISYVGLGLGGLGVVSAVVLIAIGSGGSSSSASTAAAPTQWALGPRVTGNELGLDFHARF
jgi:hypothetical protein